MRKTRASNYRHRIAIQKNTTVRGTTGEAVKGWALFVYRWASVEPLQGRELFAAQQFQSETTVRIKMRYDAKLESLDVRDYQITHTKRGNSKTYDLHAIINPYELDKELHLMCSIHNE